MSKKIYMAGPLFNEMERRRNLEESIVIEAEGYRTYLPQRDGGVQYLEDLLDEPPIYSLAESKRLFETDVKNLEESDVLFAYVDGRVPDDGMSFEMGYAYKMGIPIVIIATDSRSFEYGRLNNMLDASAFLWARNAGEAITKLEELGDVY